MSAYNSCALKNDGTFWCWGENSSSQIASGTTNALVPVELTGFGGTISAISITHLDNICVLVSGAIKCTGSNSVGQIGTAVARGSTTSSFVTVSGFESGATGIQDNSANVCGMFSG